MALEIGHRRVFEIATEIDEHTAHGGDNAGPVGAKRTKPQASHQRTLRQWTGPVHEGARRRRTTFCVMAATLPVREGLFTGDDPSRLLGGRCATCGHHHFPRHPICPYCSSHETGACELSATGRLWAWTAVTHPPPGYRGTIPYGFGVVELPEGLRVVTRLTESDPGRLSDGQPMHLVIEPLYRDEDGHPVVTYAFAPDQPATP